MALPWPMAEIVIRPSVRIMLSLSMLTKLVINWTEFYFPYAYNRENVELLNNFAGFKNNGILWGMLKFAA